MFNGSFLRVCRILRFVKKLDFAFLSLGGPSPGARVWCLGRVPKHRNQWQEVEGLLFSPQKHSVAAYFELLFLGCGFLIHLSNRSDSPRFRPRGRRYIKNMIYNRNRLYSRAIHFPASMEMHYVQWFLCFGIRPRHQTRAPCLGPPRLKKIKSNFLHKPHPGNESSKYARTESFWG